MDVSKIMEELKLRSNDNEDYRSLLRDKEQAEQFAEVMGQVADSFVSDNFDFLAEYSMMYLDQLEEEQEEGEFGDDGDIESLVSDLQGRTVHSADGNTDFDSASIENERAMIDYLNNLD